MFVPSNRGWEVAAAANAQSVDQLLASRNVLRDAVFTLVIPNAVLNSTQLAQQPSFTTQSTSLVFVSPPANPGAPLTLVSTGSSAQIVQPDAAEGCSYVLHGIDNVLLPNPSPQGGLNPAYQAALARGKASAG